MYDKIRVMNGRWRFPRSWLPVLWLRLSTEASTAGINPGCPSPGVSPSGPAGTQLPRKAPRNAGHQGWVEIRPQILVAQGGEESSALEHWGAAPWPQSALHSPRKGQASAQAPQLSSPRSCSEQRGLRDGWGGNLLRQEKKQDKAAITMSQSMTTLWVYHFIQHWPHEWDHALVQLPCTKPASRRGTGQAEKPSYLQPWLF